MFSYFTLDDFNFSSKVVCVRMDINSPVKKKKVIDNERIKQSVETVLDLKKKRCENCFDCSSR